MKKLFLSCLLLLALFSLSAETLTFRINGFNSLYAEAVPVEIEWEESWLGAAPATIYNHNLARAACMLAELSYSDMAETYRIFGVADEDMELHYDLDYEDSSWGNDQCAFSFAAKTIASAQGERTLLFIVIRGTPAGKNEWISNLNINDGEQENTFIHRGFAKASEQIRQALCRYLDGKGIDKKHTYVLMAGHSRGGAVANLLAAELANMGLFTADNIYTYTFSAPNITSIPSNAEDDYGFIWNLVNAEDIIPAFPFYDGKWSFHRYGHTLTLINAWNTDYESFENEYLPRMNVYFKKLIGREYCPFKAGPFIQTQAAEISRSISTDIAQYYSSFPNLHDFIMKLSTSINPSPEQGKSSFLTRWLNKRTKGMYDYMFTALADMHANETYLCWLLALAESELFSTLGCSKLIVEGMEDATVFDGEGNILASVADGHIIYTSVKPPLVVFQSKPNKTIIGLPWNRRLAVIIRHKSLLPSSVTITEQRFTSCGELLDEGTPRTIRISRSTPYVFYPQGGHEQPHDEESPERYRQRQQIRLHPVLNADSAGDLCCGFQLGTPFLYGTLLAGTGTSANGRSWELSPGLGTQLTLVSPLCLDLAAFARLRWQAEDDGRAFYLLPSLHASFTLKVTRSFSLTAGSSMDFIISGFNDGYTEARYLAQQYSLGKDLHILPGLFFGICF